MSWKKRHSIPIIRSRMFLANVLTDVLLIIPNANLSRMTPNLLSTDREDKKLKYFSGTYVPITQRYISLQKNNYLNNNCLKRMNTVQVSEMESRISSQMDMEFTSLKRSCILYGYYMQMEIPIIGLG